LPNHNYSLKKFQLFLAVESGERRWSAEGPLSEFVVDGLYLNDDYSLKKNTTLKTVF
jgi:hypothetical protein